MNGGSVGAIREGEPMTAPHFDTEHVTVWHGDCIDVMRTLPDASVDAVVTDPPYGLEFMGREWDGADGFRRSLNAADVGRENTFGRMSAKAPEYRAGKLFQDWCELWATEALRVLKPGGHLLAFGGTRTFHRLTAGIEDAGFEIRDSIAWLYGSGFPKSLDVSKAIDRMHGTEREVIGSKLDLPGYHLVPGARGGEALGQGLNGHTAEERLRASQVTAPATEDAARWAGWGTALKPAFEPIVVARKPLESTVAANVLRWGTGALNIDGSRIGHASADDLAASQAKNPGRTDTVTSDVYGAGRPQQSVNTGGRWPANVVLDASQAAALDTQSGTTTSPPIGSVARTRGGASIGTFGFEGRPPSPNGHGDSGGASRFFKTVDDVTPRFMYTAKAGSDERPNVDGVAHPTVKSLDLMRWLVKLVTPKGGTVLEPFAGSGTTVEAAVLEGFRCIAIEREADYLPLIMQRVSKPHAVGLDFGDWEDVS